MWRVFSRSLHITFHSIPSLLRLFLVKMFAGGETYAPEAKVSFLSSLVSSPSPAQTTAKDLWSARVPPPAEAEVQSAMASQEPGLLPRCLSVAKGKVRNTGGLHAPLPPAASRLRAARRDLRPKMAPESETGACKLHKLRSALNYQVRKDFQPSIPVSHTSLDIVVTLCSPADCGKVSL